MARKFGVPTLTKCTWTGIANNVERVHTQYLKRILGCNYSTSNNMIRGEVGSRPLIVDIIKRVVNYTKYIENRPTSTVNKDLNF